MEIWDVYDIDRQLTGRSMERGYVFEPGDFHLGVNVCIFNAGGEMLIQQRQSHKGNWPNLWDLSVGGCAVKGDNSRTAAEREVFEELGIRIDLEGVLPVMTLPRPTTFNDVYVIDLDVDIDSLSLQTDEVQGAKWAGEAEILEMLERGEFVPYRTKVIELIFALREGYGLYR